MTSLLPGPLNSNIKQNSAGDSERRKKEKTEDIGRRHQRMNWNGFGDSLRALEDVIKE